MRSRRTHVSEVPRLALPDRALCYLARSVTLSVVKRLASLAFLVATVACAKDPPRPAEGTSKPVGEARPPAGCIVKVAIRADTIAYAGGGLEGTLPKVAPDMSVLAPVARTCSVRVSATQQTPYRDVVAVMEAMHRVGLEVSIGDGPRTPGKRLPSALPSPGDDATEQPYVIVIRVGTSDVMIQGQSIGASPFAAGLTAAIQSELSKGTRPIDPNVILEVDQTLPFSVVAQVVEAVEASGYTSLAFAVGR
jgi:biopolymer transport protein ExbD